MPSGIASLAGKVFSAPVAEERRGNARSPALQLFDVLAVVVTVTALIGYANERWVRLPTAIGVLAGGLVVSLALIGVGQLGLGGEQ